MRCFQEKHHTRAIEYVGADAIRPFWLTKPPREYIASVNTTRKGLQLGFRLMNSKVLITSVVSQTVEFELREWPNGMRAPGLEPVESRSDQDISRKDHSDEPDHEVDSHRMPSQELPTK